MYGDTTVAARVIAKLKNAVERQMIVLTGLYNYKCYSPFMHFGLFAAGYTCRHFILVISLREDEQKLLVMYHRIKKNQM